MHGQSNPHPALDAWDPLSPAEVGAALTALPIPWWIGGGWAVDLAVGRSTRPHRDLDVVVLRPHAAVMLAHLAEGWHPYTTGRPTGSGLERWSVDHDVGTEVGSDSAWIAHPDGTRWAFELAFMDIDQGRWILRGNPGVGGPVTEMGWATDDGILVIRPEIALLFKALRAESRPEDDQDLAVALPLLSHRQRSWLGGAVESCCGPGHRWLPGLHASPSGDEGSAA